MFSEILINLPEISSSSVSSIGLEAMGREVHGLFCLRFPIWRVGAAKVDLKKSKLCKGVFDKGGSSDQVGFG